MSDYPTYEPPPETPDDLVHGRAILPFSAGMTNVTRTEFGLLKTVSERGSFSPILAEREGVFHVDETYDLLVEYLTNWVDHRGTISLLIDVFYAAQQHGYDWLVVNAKEQA